MKLENGRELLYFPAYYKGRYVNVPLLHLPEAAIDNEGVIRHFTIISIDHPQEIDPLPIRESKAVKKYQALFEETIDPNILSDRDLKQICGTDIPIEWVTDLFSRKKRREKRIIKSITNKEFALFKRELKEINKIAALIIEICWVSNQKIMNSGLFVTTEEILLLKLDDLSQDSEEGPISISFMNMNRKNPQVISFSLHSRSGLPSRLSKSLSRYIERSRNKGSIFVFPNQHGGPLSPIQINRDLKKAAKRAKIDDKSSTLSLRPQFNKGQSELYSKKHQQDFSVREYLEPVNLNEWETICKHIPGISEREGRKASHNSLDVLNAILYYLKTGCPIRKLPLTFPPWKAVESQYRRWKKRGILDELFKLRQAKRGV